MARTRRAPIDVRLAKAGRRIDEVAERALDVREDTRVRVEQRVRVLRAKEARARVAAAELDHRIEAALDEIDAEIAIADAQLALDGAEDQAAFAAAAERLLDAYRGLARPMRGRTAAAAERLQLFRDAPADVADSLRAPVLVALDDLDRTATERSVR